MEKISTTQYRRRSFSSSTTSSLAKRNVSSSSESNEKTAAFPLSKKRAPLSDITNQRNNNNGVNSTSSSSSLSATKIVKKKNVSPSREASTLPASLSSKAISNVLSKVSSLFSRSEEPVPTAVPAPLCGKDGSPSKSEGGSVSMDETMSTWDSIKSPDVEYIDNHDVSVVDSIDRKMLNNLYILDNAERADMEVDGKIVNLDDNLTNPQLCATFACDIYKHLRASEVKKKPAIDYMDRVQKGVTASMRAILIDWLVEVAEEYKLVSDTLFLTINYIDRYLSGNVMNSQRLQLLGVACMMIAAKYEEVCAPQVEEFCYITDNTYFKDEVLEMESTVLNYLKFEMTAPTAKCFLRRFIRAAQVVRESSSMKLECMANYIAELSLVEYSMLCYAPSLVAASAIFLAKYILDPSKRPWNSTLQYYTLYQPSDLCNCVKDLHRLCCYNNSTFHAVREKYSQDKYKYVAKKYCRPLIPPEFFQNSVL